MTREEQLLKDGFYRIGYNGDNPEHCYLSYRLVDGKVVRVTITTNPWLIMSKQQKGETFVFVIVPKKNANYKANEEIISFNTGQHLFDVYTIRQALKRIHKHNQKFTELNLKEFLEIYNKDAGTNADIWRYGAKRYAPKGLVDTIVSFYSDK